MSPPANPAPFRVTITRCTAFGTVEVVTPGGVVQAWPPTENEGKGRAKLRLIPGGKR